MSTIRHVALAILLTTVATQPARAETCNLTVTGKPVVDDEPCTVSKRAGVVRIEVGNTGTIVIRRSLLMASFSGTQDPLRANARQHRLRSFGLTVKSDSNDKLCYFNQKATLCIEQ